MPGSRLGRATGRLLAMLTSHPHSSAAPTQASELPNPGPAQGTDVLTQPSPELSDQLSTTDGQPAPSKPARIVQLFGRMVDRSGQPAAGVGITLGFKLRKLSIAGTVSDSNGAFVLTYLSTAVPPLAKLDRGDAPVFFLSVNKNPVTLVTVDGQLDLSSLGSSAKPGHASIYGPIHLVTENGSPADHTNVAPRARLLGGSETMLAAFKRAPGIFTRPVSANVAGCCGPASPSDMATRVYYLNQFALFDPPQTFTTQTKSAVGGSAAAAAPESRADKKAAPVNYVKYAPAAPTEPLWGAMVQFKQEWWDLGFTLGDLLYSVPLAPGEETKIATVDWRRQDYAQRSTTLDENAFQDTTISRDQAVDQAVYMNSDKNVCDGTVGGGLGISYGPLSIGASGQYSTAHDVTSANSTSTTNINDRIHQASLTTRQTQAYSVVETTQQEQVTATTRVLRNHNHCHTVTFQYYEVLRQFRITTQAVSAQPVLFVPFEATQFGLNEVLQYGYILRRGLIDTTLQPVFDEYLGVTPPPGTTTTSTTTSSAPPSAAASYATFQVVAFVSDPKSAIGDLYLMVDDDVTNNGQITSNGPFYTIKFTFTNAKQFPGIQKIGLANTMANQTWPAAIYFDNLEISAIDAGGAPHLVYFNRNVQVDANREFVDLVSNSAIATQPSEAGGPDLTRLLNHLNANSAYYTNIIVMASDASKRYATLDSVYGCASTVDNTVIGTLGNYVVFPSSWKQYGEAEPKWDPGESEQLITLPTPGLFAESQMGSCSACEAIDTTTFWDWQKSPTPESAPDITSAMLASRFQDLSSLTLPTQSTLQPPGVQIPSEPKPPITIGDATLASLVKDLNLTKANDVMNLAKGLVSASTQGYRNMVNAGQGSPGMTSDGTGGGGNGSSSANGGAGGGAAGDAGASLTPSDTAVVPTDAIATAAEA
jgi:hypothetical protein